MEMNEKNWVGILHDYVDEDGYNEVAKLIGSLFQENQELKDKLRKIELTGWKGKDKIIIEKIGTEWVITEHRKDKETGEIGNISTTIPEQYVVDVWEIIKKRCGTFEKTKYRELAHDLILKNNLSLSLDEFNGGKNRKNYFKTYYYPVKILEDRGFINYTGRGGITRLK